MAGFVEVDANDIKKCLSSSSVGAGIVDFSGGLRVLVVLLSEEVDGDSWEVLNSKGVGDSQEGEQGGVGEFEEEGVDIFNRSCWLFFFPMKSISFIGAYGTSLIALGMTQYAFF